MATRTEGKKASPVSAAKAATGRKPTRQTAKRSNGGKKSQDRLQMIAEAAYFRAAARGFVSGDTLQDWLDAENEINRMLGN